MVKYILNLDNTKLKGDRFFSIVNYKKPWVENGIKPYIVNIRTNGWLNINHTCLDLTITVGYIVIEYTNYEYQKSHIIKIAKLLNKINIFRRMK